MSQLGELVILGHIRIEVIFAIKFHMAWQLAMKQITCQCSQSQGFFIGNGEYSGHAKADRANLGVGLGPVLIGTATPHFRLGFELDVGFKPDDRFVFHGMRSLYGSYGMYGKSLRRK